LTFKQLNQAKSKIIDEFELGEILGKGAAGEVRQIKHYSTRESRVLKMINLATLSEA
jgi:hypothetical protein